MKNQTLFGVMFVGVGAALAGVVFGPVIQQALLPPPEIERAYDARRLPPGPYTAAPPAADFVGQHGFRQPVPAPAAVERHMMVAPASVPMPNQHAQQLARSPFASSMSASGQVPMPAVQSQPIQSQPVLSQSVLSQPVLLPPAEADPIQLPSVSSISEDSPIVLPTEMPTLEISAPQMPEIELELAESETQHQQSHQQTNPDCSVLENEVSSTRPLPNVRVATPVQLGRQESTSDPEEESAMAATETLQLASRAIRNEDVGVDGREDQGVTVERASFESTQPREPEPRRLPEVQRPVRQSVQEVPETVARSLPAAKLQRRQVSPLVEKRVAEHVEYGESLFGRQSFLGAREEFTLALLVISSGHDTGSESRAYSDRLVQALTALDEVNDFAALKRGGSVKAIKQKIRLHKTRLILPEELESLNPTRAMDLYCGFAQSQFEQALGYSVGGSQALHALGKLETMVPKSAARVDSTGRARALVFFRSAMRVDPGNAVCSNDLGVLLYDMGRFEEAEEALKVSLGRSQSQRVWENLTMVHREMAANANGEERQRQGWLADLAAREVQNFVDGKANSGAVLEQWASPAEFEARAAFPGPVNKPTNSGQMTSPMVNPSPASSLLQKVKGWY